MPYDDSMAELAQGHLVTTDNWNTLVNNIDALKNPQFVEQTGNTSDRTTTSTSFTQVHSGTNLDITTTGGILRVSFSGQIAMNTAGQQVRVTVYIDGANIGSGTFGLTGCVQTSNADTDNCSFSIPVEGLAAGVHDVDLYWQTSAGTATLIRNYTFSAEER